MSPLVLWDDVTATWVEPGAGSTPPVGAAPVITTATVGPFTVGVPVDVVIAYTGSPATSAAVVGTALQAGLSLVLTAGVARITGTPSAASTRTSTIRLTNAYGSGERIYTITVAAAGIAPSFVTNTLGPFTVGQDVNVAIEYTGNAATSASRTSGALPTGLSFGLVSGVPRVTGTCTAAGEFTATLQLGNAFGTGSRSFTATVLDVGYDPLEAWYQANTGCRIDEEDLIVHTGSHVFSTPGQTISGRIFNSLVLPNAANITFVDCIFNAGYWGIETYGRDCPGLLVEHSTFVGGADAGLALTGGQSATVRYCNVSGGYDGMKLAGGPITLEYNYIHDLNTSGVDPHNDGLQVMGSATDLTLYRNWIHSPDTSCLAVFAGQSTLTGASLEENIFLGAGWLLYLGGAGGTGIEVNRNMFDDWFYGPVTDWSTSGTGNSQSENRRFHTTAAVTF